eukprot:UN01899
MTETCGYELAMVNVGGGRQIYIEDVRNNDRCIVDHDIMVETIYERLLALGALPQTFVVHHHGRGGSSKIIRYYELVGLNERLRFLRYKPGQEFKMHRDGTYMRDHPSADVVVGSENDTNPNNSLPQQIDHNDNKNNKKLRDMSFLTLLIYLNDTTGGQTRFYDEAAMRGAGTPEEIALVPQYDVQPTTGTCLIFTHPILHHGLPVSGGLKYCVRSDVMYRLVKEEEEIDHHQ